LKEKNAAYFNWKVSDRSWVRVGSSPYFFMSASLRSIEIGEFGPSGACNINGKAIAYVIEDGLMWRAVKVDGCQGKTLWLF
jgi:hypothetical protein